MGKRTAGRARTPDRRRRGEPAIVKWGLVLVLAGIVAYGVSQSSGVAYDEKAIAVVDFSGLDATQKRAALQAANRSRCTCGCGMNTAQCVATDSTCPLRDDNIRRIRGMVREAAAQKG